MKLFLKLTVVVLIVVVVHSFLNNSKEVVQNMSITDLMHTVYSVSGNPAVKKQNEKQLDYALSKMAQQGWDVNKVFINALKDNSYIKNAKFNLIENNMKGLDKVEVSMILSNNNLEMPIKIFFFVQPKSKLSIYSFLEIPHSAKLLPLITVELNINGKINKLTDNQVADFIPSLYDKKATKSFFMGLKNR